MTPPADLDALQLAWTATLADDTWPDNDNEVLLLKAIPDLLSELNALQQRADKAEAALRRYGQHDRHCSDFRTVTPENCECGLFAALASGNEGKETP